ncbi:helix-turn-helix transcriptional regulator [Enterocloster asparagiformis]|uniref:helix-turn-helix domain-containing protein n=1 Tax=Enterocloster asparagiformis TaxID=333367 RepID=UPI002A7F558F|nr:helix-turn-helix transcriptional regulator [Enterocloster asparagiformis]
MPYLHMRINELLAERGMSKNVVCKALNISRTNFNRYCRDEFQRIEASLICKLCTFLKCIVGDLIVYVDEDTHELKSPEI